MARRADMILGIENINFCGTLTDAYLAGTCTNVFHKNQQSGQSKRWYYNSTNQPSENPLKY